MNSPPLSLFLPPASLSSFFETGSSCIAKDSPKIFILSPLPLEHLIADVYSDTSHAIAIFCNNAQSKHCEKVGGEDVVEMWRLRMSSPSFLRLDCTVLTLSKLLRVPRFSWVALLDVMEEN